MKKRCVSITTLLLIISPVFASAAPIGGPSPGLKKLIDSADAIVVLRIDRHLSDFYNDNFYSKHECYIYQTIKGDILKNASINLWLRNTQGSFATPYAHGSTHLMFLMRKTNEDEPTEYQTLTFNGAQIQLSPLGHEKAPKGKDIEEKLRNLIKNAITYQAAARRMGRFCRQSIVSYDRLSTDRFTHHVLSGKDGCKHPSYFAKSLSVPNYSHGLHGYMCKNSIRVIRAIRGYSITTSRLQIFAFLQTLGNLGAATSLPVYVGCST